MSVNHQHFLAVIALGSNRIGFLEAFTKVSKQCGCNIVDSKLTSMGEECGLILHLAGSWNTIAKLEAALPSLAQQQDFTLRMKRTLPRLMGPALPYHVQIIAQDKPGILHGLAAFFRNEGINIDQMNGETYAAKNSTLLTSISFGVSIPAKLHLASIRERLMIYCEERNLDAIIEPDRDL